MNFQALSVARDALQENVNAEKLRGLRALIKADGCWECAHPAPKGVNHHHADVDRAQQLRASLLRNQSDLLLLLDFALGDK